MIEPLKQAYLEAMGFDVWVPRPERPLRGRLLVTPGEGSTLLVVASADDQERAIARDVDRALGGQAAWAWPDSEGRADSPSLEDAVRDGLFTQVIVFGARLAEELFEGEAPQVVASSAVAVAAELEDLATRGSAKKQLWRWITSGSASPPVS